ncbi:MAG TPA: phage portal protein [Actinophytocola sp.]|uniref:phage portal protein n=1 Tax=Actinophytocola sp. TaxID=1872138 RepID=UPI002DDD813B|nr:phage portal protein [Actinophytocola sp.]HEV2778830.1 phage portal protein [Actinophytocola sp.]
MSLLDEIRGRFDRRRGGLSWPAGRAVVEPLDRAFGHDDSLFVPEEYGDYLATSNEIYSAASLRSRLASTPLLRLYHGDSESKREVSSSPAARVLNYVNPFWTRRRLSRMDSLCMDIFGETAWAIHKPQGQPEEIWWVKPSRLSPVPDESNYIDRWIYESNVDGEKIVFRTDEIVWFRYPNPLDEFSAMSPLAAARLAADTASAMMKANRNLHKQGVQIAGIVSPKGDRIRYSRDQALELADDLERRFAGSANAHRWAVLRYEAEFKPVTMSPKDAEFILGLGLTLRQVCNAYGIPSPLLNDLEHATLANIREFQTAIWEHSLVPDLALRADEIVEQFLPMFSRNGRLEADHAEYDFSNIAALQKSKMETWDRDRQALEVGAITINEWRKRNGLPPVKWGDVFWAPVNKAPVKDGKTMPVPPTPDQPAEPDGAEDEQLGSTEQAWRRVMAALEMDLTTVNGHGGH